jgi:hypothetical protein
LNCCNIGWSLDIAPGVVLQDADILWFRDPFPNFADDSDFQIACDKYVGGPFDVRMNAPNGGFIFVRSNTHTIAMYRYWYAARLRVPGKHDQDVLSVVLHEKGFGRLGVKIRFLEPLYFSGFCQVWQLALLFTKYWLLFIPLLSACNYPTYNLSNMHNAE